VRNILRRASLKNSYLDNTCCPFFIFALSHSLYAQKIFHYLECHHTLTTFHASLTENIPAGYFSRKNIVGESERKIEKIYAVDVYHIKDFHFRFSLFTI
jgi:hypothetical protein